MNVEPDYDSVLATVSAWSAERRASLAHALIESLAQDSAPRNGRKPTLDQLVGVARGDGPPPSDQQVKQWIDEQRMQKYGR